MAHEQCILYLPVGLATSQLVRDSLFSSYYYCLYNLGKSLESLVEKPVIGSQHTIYILGLVKVLFAS